jgi:hypothetical protein
MTHAARDLARALSRRAADVCRHYLSNGQRQGAYWTVGDVSNRPGRSLYVRLTGPDLGPGAAGHWTDAASGEHGDLLDLIGLAGGLERWPEVLAEAARFLALPPPPRDPVFVPIRTGAPEQAARRLFARARPIAGSIAEAYLAQRGIVGLTLSCLRFHPRLAYRPYAGADPEARPALLAAVTDLAGRTVGVQRTWLAPDGSGKAAIATPRRALGTLLRHGVRIGGASDVLAAGEGLETTLSLVMAVPQLPVVAALSANHLAALALPPGLRRLYVARDNDPAGERAALRLGERAKAAGVEAIDLVPLRGDFNDDLLADGRLGLRAQLERRMLAEDLARFS